MEMKISNCFTTQKWCGGAPFSRQVNVRFYPLPSQRLQPASGKIRQRRNLSLQNKKQQTKKINIECPPDVDLQSSDDVDSNTEKMSKQSLSSSNQEISIEEKVATLTETKSSDEISYLSVDSNEEGQPSSVHLQDLIVMIRNAEKNIHQINEARVHVLEELQKVLGEKEGLHEEIKILEMKLAETDAVLRVAAQEKIHVKLLEDQLEKLKNELTSSRGSEENVLHVNNSVPLSHSDTVNSLSEELDSLRKENILLKKDLQAMKSELSLVKETDEHILMLEKERSVLESSLSELESKLAASQEDVSELSALKLECKNLYEKVEHLQMLLAKATKQADQAITVLQQNQELLKKVDRLEESLEEASIYKLSSEKLQQYNEQMQQKIKLLDERLQRSDEEIQSYVQLYQDSVKEFQDTLDNLKKETKKKPLDEPVNDMPWEFWSRLLLMIEGWSMEKKISKDDAKLLRELVWKRDGRICDAYMSCKEKNDHEILAAFLRFTSSPTRTAYHPYCSRDGACCKGGLGDVVAGLGKALQKKGHLVEIVLPKYDCMQYESIKDMKVLDVVVESYFDGRLYKNNIWTGTVEGLPVYFIEPQHPGKFFCRGQLYGEHDDFKRFSFFSRVALELLLQAEKRPDIIHCHEWQTAFVAPLYWEIYVPKGLDSARICFTCHNFEYQGTAPASELTSCGLDAYHLNRPDRMQDNSANDRINPVKGAIVFSNIVTTVSPTYAQEVRSAQGGKGLHATINSHSKKFAGILNGIDTDAWNPTSDNFLKVQYSASDIDGKIENKEALRRLLGLSSSDFRRPLVGCITRLVPQKGVHLIRHAIYRTLELGGQFVLLGSSPVPHIQREFEDIGNHFQNHKHARLVLKYDEALSHLIYAASDMLIVPSIFEPCGLTQMIAMRYGSIPIARKTGGLNDSVFDIDDDSIPIQFRNGFTFVTADEQGFNNALERAFNYYMNNTETWKELVQKDMSIDFSWDSSASQYEELYEKAVLRARAASRS
ncbi:probable starch synthase 4, chloroplastic/amyloplastic isoform X2 [Solanum dulcamara]|uniref:probable starch synthase 4, chloroplastic/amyloplastic isoform X2 n=1 Tax=Solanum dulcamara TaxID=45834 RepID=UPI002485FCF1|nr:probable starch synthase 4, chloroplastic/amyloplastic isoform X2 [Solanum dulcamara]